MRLPVLALLLYVGLGTLGGMLRVGAAPAGGGPVVYLLPGPIHTDLILPMTPEAREIFAFLSEDGIPSREWLIVGWGAREFYTTTGSYADLETVAIWSAMMGDTSVMRVHPIGSFEVPDDMTALDLSPAQFSALLNEVRTGFDGAVPNRLPVPGLTGGDHFYAGTGRFNLFRTCNVWVGEVLRGANIRAGLWTPFTWSLP